MDKLKKILQSYLNKNVLDKVSEYGVSKILVYKVRYPSKGNNYGAIFVVLTLNDKMIKNYDIVVQKVQEYVYDFLSLLGETGWDWDVYVGPDSETSFINSLDDDSLPFEETNEGNLKIRVFSESTDDSEFKWHQDNEDRMVRSLHETDWMVQLDNQLPIRLSPSNKIVIPEGIWHRVIKGSGDLKVEIKFIKH